VTAEGTREDLRYDPFGVLLSRQAGTKVVSYVGDRATVTGTLAAGCNTPSCGINPATVQVDVHVTVVGLRLASVRSGAGTGRTMYLHRDRLGSVVATTLAGGVRGASYRWGAYGSLEGATSDTGDAQSELGYTGAVRLSGGLVAMGVRVYHPGLKTFLEPDPLVPFKYDYAGGDPINRVDPTGMEDYHVTESMPGSSRTMNTPPPAVITCVQSGGCTEGIDVVGKRPFRRKLGPSDTFHEWRSGRYHERTAGLGNTHRSYVNGGRQDRHGVLASFDYITLSVGFYDFVGGGIHVNVDRNGWVTLGPNVGVGLGGKGTGLAFGTYDGDAGTEMHGSRPTPGRLRALNRGWSMNLGAAVIVGIGVNWPQAPWTATELLLQVPGFALTGSYSWEVGQIPWLAW
jgi:RHS repeat-associated protein